MSNALLSDVEARAERRRTQTRETFWNELVQRDWRRAQAATDPAERRRWLERAHRTLPADNFIACSLASSLLAASEYRPAAAIFRRLAERFGVPEAWAGLATCHHKLGDRAAARAATASLIRCSVLTPTLRALADTVAAPLPWCAVRADGAIHSSRVARAILVDGQPIAIPRRGPAMLPKHWRTADSLEVLGPEGPMLGSPIALRPFAGVEGFVAAEAGGIVGWAWQPTDPDAAPTIRLQGPNGGRSLVLAAPAEDLELERPLARPRRLALPAGEVALLGEPLSVTGPDGRHLLGSPVYPGLLARPGPGFTPIWADSMGGPPVARARPAGRTVPVDVVVPVYRGAAETLACLDSVLAGLPRGARVIVVDDATPDRALAAALDGLAGQRRITLIRLAENAGFPAAANAGLRAAAGRDAILLNSDTLVPPGWLERLRAAAYRAPDIGTVTPLTNDGTIVSYPEPSGRNAIPDLAGTIELDALAQRANAGLAIDLPVGVGFCLYLRRDCLDQAGVLREDIFAQGYGEENDLCLRARQHGWRNVAALDVFVGHVGATSFGSARTHLVKRNTAILNRLHPGYDAVVKRHQTEDPLRPARARMDAIRWDAGRRRAGALVAITHAGGGGVDLVVAARLAAAAERGLRAITLRPQRLPDGTVAARLHEPGGVSVPNLVFPIPSGLGALATLLRPDRVRSVELHHLLGHHHGIAGLAGLLKAEAVSIVHDYARFCPRIALVSTQRRYCGEPDIAGCEACIADLGSLLEDDPAVPELVARSAAELGGAARIVAPSADAAARIARHFPGTRPEVESWDDDSALHRPLPWVRQERLRIAIVGAIGVEKGYDVLLACARDAASRDLPLEFIVVGYTSDDERLLAAGPVFITGEYRDDEAVGLIRGQRAQAAFIPSVWPETWCFALTRAWEAGLPAFVFDLGAQAERVRNCGRGWTLPLGLPPHAVNDALLRLAPGRGASQSPRHSI